MSIRSQQLLRKIGAGFFILLLLFFLTDYFRTKANYGEMVGNLEYNNVLYENITLEVMKGPIHPEISKENYFQVTNILSNNKNYPYLLRKDIYLEMSDALAKQVQGTNQFIVSGRVTSNNFGMLKMDVEKVDMIN